MELKKFENSVFGTLECFTDENNEPWFMAHKITAALGYTNGKKAVADHCDVDDVKKEVCEVAKRDSTPKEDTECDKNVKVTKRYPYEEQNRFTKAVNSRKTRTYTFINESGLYSLILASKLPQAKQFKNWVTKEVLPTIRQTGGYVPVQETDDEESLLAKAMVVAQKTLERLRKKNEEQKKMITAQSEQVTTLTNKVAEMQEKVSYLDRIMQCKSTMLVTQIAQDYGMSAKQFNAILAETNVQHKVNGQWILYGKYLAEGYVHSKPVQIPKQDGTILIKENTEWTQKGRLFLYQFLKKHDILPLIER